MHHRLLFFFYLNIFSVGTIVSDTQRSKFNLLSPVAPPVTPLQLEEGPLMCQLTGIFTDLSIHGWYVNFDA